MKKLSPITYHLKPSRGFTLIEMLVSISVFMVVMTVAAGSLLSIIDANGKAQSLKSAVNNLNFAIGSMAKEIRVGTDYKCDNSDCSLGADNINFTSSSNQDIKYNFNSNSIERCISSLCQQMTAKGVNIDSLKFYIKGSNPARVLITVSGTAGTKVKLQTKFNLQTTVSQRSF